jgi:formylglycine-generating enzyme required for sulfatase activity
MKIRFFTLFLIFILTAATVLSVAAQPVGSRAKPLNLGDVIVALRAPGKTLAAKNEALIRNARSRGVDFPLTREIEKILRDEGASDLLLAEIREKFTVAGTTDLQSKEIKNALGMQFVLIPKGSFMMGGSVYDKEYDKTEGPQRKVTINYDFYLGKYEITQAQWKAVMGGNPSEFPECGANCPVENVSWDMAKKFIEKLNARKDGYVYRLPSEAEWEYAARAGTTTQFYWGEDTDYSQMCKYANVPDRTALAFEESWNVAKCSDGYEKTAPVGKFLPNKFGLYDMSGNIWEWVEDIDSPDYNNLPTNGSANLTIGDRATRILRGGSWAFRPWDSRSADRTGVSTDFKSYVTGFRVVIGKQ